MMSTTATNAPNPTIAGMAARQRRILSGQGQPGPDNTDKEFGEVLTQLAAIGATTQMLLNRPAVTPPTPGPSPLPAPAVWVMPPWVPYAIAIATVVLTAALHFLQSIPAGASPLTIAILGLGALLTILASISALLSQRYIQAKALLHEQAMLVARQ